MAGKTHTNIYLGDFRRIRISESETWNHKNKEDKIDGTKFIFALADPEYIFWTYVPKKKNQFKNWVYRIEIFSTFHKKSENIKVFLGLFKRITTVLDF